MSTVLLLHTFLVGGCSASTTPITCHLKMSQLNLKRFTKRKKSLILNILFFCFIYLKTGLNMFLVSFFCQFFFLFYLFIQNIWVLILTFQSPNTQPEGFLLLFRLGPNHEGPNQAYLGSLAYGVVWHPLLRIHLPSPYSVWPKKKKRVPIPFTLSFFSLKTISTTKALEWKFPSHKNCQLPFFSFFSISFSFVTLQIYLSALAAGIQVHGTLQFIVAFDLSGSFVTLPLSL